MTNFTPEMEEQLTRRIIELIHEAPYDEAIEEEISFGCRVSHKYSGAWEEDIIIKQDDWSPWYKGINCGALDLQDNNKTKIRGLPITIGRVMQAIGDRPNLQFYLRNYGFGDTYIECWEQIEDYSPTMVFKWELTKENGQECTLLDQSNETKLALYNLFFTK